jgi:hypothetical protein
MPECPTACCGDEWHPYFIIILIPSQEIRIVKSLYLKSLLSSISYIKQVCLLAANKKLYGKNNLQKSFLDYSPVDLYISFVSMSKNLKENHEK